MQLTGREAQGSNVACLEWPRDKVKWIGKVLILLVTQPGLHLNMFLALYSCVWSEVCYCDHFGPQLCWKEQPPPCLHVLKQPSQGCPSSSLVVTVLLHCTFHAQMWTESQKYSHSLVIRVLYFHLYVPTISPEKIGLNFPISFRTFLTN